MEPRRRRVLLGVTGSVAAFKAAALASRLVQAGLEVKVVLSAGAREFVGPATFEGLTGEAVHGSIFEEGQMMAHIHLARWADLTLVYPASANTLTRLASGRADDLLGALFLAHDFKTPYWVAPAMNPSMYAHPAVRDASAKLEGWGVRLLSPDSGRMACGEVGEGRLIEPEAMLDRVLSHFGTSSGGVALKSRARVLITAGGTTEAIDPVRVLTNTSTGETGIRMAQGLSQAGCETHLLLSAGSPCKSLLGLGDGVHVEEFGDFSDLDSRMRAKLGGTEFDWVIHAAAVSDYEVSRVEDLTGRELSRDAKIHSGEGLRLVLKPLPKIVARLREYSRGRGLRVVSFKLTTGGERAPELGGYDSDYIVHNDLSGLDRAAGVHAGVIYAKRGPELSRVLEFDDKDGLIRGIRGLVLEERKT